MFWKKDKENQAKVEWQSLDHIEQLNTVIEESHEKPVLIYKHSTRCGISGMTMSRLERGWTEDLNVLKTYYLDLIAYRDLSNEIANRFGVYHESPQVILIRNGNAVYNESHMGISADNIRLNIKKG